MAESKGETQESLNEEFSRWAMIAGDKAFWIEKTQKEIENIHKIMWDLKRKS